MSSIFSHGVVYTRPNMRECVDECLAQGRRCRIIWMFSNYSSHTLCAGENDTDCRERMVIKSVGGRRRVRVEQRWEELMLSSFYSF